ncbi:WD40 repeat-like protein [Auriculariales sp. MPI-PUGE-AT-0066]|nr:WD40 repeat-like protein [Auriculariales sp. MPI-PUGE-AT-0066]
MLNKTLTRTKTRTRRPTEMRLPSSDATGATRDPQDEDEEHDDESMGLMSPERPAQRTPTHSALRDQPTTILDSGAQTQTSLSPEQTRKSALFKTVPYSRTYTIEPIAAMPHPVPTHCLAASLCMSHLMTGSEDGFVRDYDLFATCNSKIFLTQPQRTHCGMGDSNIKTGILRFWFDGLNSTNPAADAQLVPIYSLALHSDALWCLAGNREGHIGLFTVRHAPGTMHARLQGHRKAVSALALLPDEKGVYSAGWDNMALQWDLNTGQIARQFQGHTAQLAAVAVRPTVAPSSSETEGVEEADARSENSFDDLFDGPDDDDATTSSRQNGADASQFALALPSTQASGSVHVSASNQAPRGIPPLSPHTYSDYSPDMLLTASIDGQVVIWDRRQRDKAGRLDMGDRCPPWCISACWSTDGTQVYVGRRNGTIDMWDLRQIGNKNPSTPRVLKLLRNPPSSGMVSCIVPFPDGKHLACASQDNIRLWNIQEADSRPKALGFKIVAGHHGGTISQMLVDRNCRFLITASGDRGWSGDSTKTILVHDIKRVD